MKRSLTHCLVTFVLIISSALIFGCASNDGPSTNDSGTDPVAPPSDASLDLFINQVETECLPSGSARLNAYVSVIDEESHLVENLNLSNFQVSDNSTVIDSGNIIFSSLQNILPDPVSVAIIMDYSDSITEAPQTQASMESAVLAFIDLMGPQDQAEIIKFNTGIRFIQPFTSNKAVLREAVTNMEGVEPGTTYLYDTLYYGIEDLMTQEGRLAVVAITDGRESHQWDYPGDGRTIDDVIGLATSNQVPLFLIGLGQDINVQELNRMADETSGHLYRAATGNELNEIYTSISDLLTEGQYLIQFDSTSAGQTGGMVNITVTHADLTDSADGSYSPADCQ